MTFQKDQDSGIKKGLKSYDGVVFNQYKIIKQIGSGGMGNVYLAKRNDGQYEKNVAIKILSQGYNNKSYKNRFLREKQILAQLRHPNIVPLLDAGETDDGIPWFVLEYIEGNVINDFIKNHELNTEGIVNLVIKICDAIHFAHSQGVIHRDIKPANIIIESIDGEYLPIILDFGIAHKKDRQNLTGHGNIIGTPGYMSPEQISGSKVIDRRSDIFSLGVVMFELFTRKKLFKAKTILEMHKQVILGKSKRISKLIPSFPNDLETIIETCIKKKATNRYQSMLELKQDLSSWINGDPIKAHKESWVKAVWRSVKRNKTITALIATIVIISVIAVAKYTYDIKQEKQTVLNAKAESDDLFNFLLKDLYTELTEIGRVSLLQTVAEKNLQHLNKYNFEMTNEKKLNYVKAYRNIGSVLDLKRDNTPSIEAFNKAKNILLELNQADSDDEKLSLLALTHSDLAGLYLNNGELDLAMENHNQAYVLAQQLVKLNSSKAIEATWNALYGVSWTLMELTKYQPALKKLKSMLKICNDMLKRDKTNVKWLNNKYKSLVSFGWYYIDIGDYDQSISFYQQALVIVDGLLVKKPDSPILIRNLQQTNNQIAYAYNLNKDFDNAVEKAKKAVQYGNTLHLIAPKNYAFNRALSYAHTMLGDAYKQKNINTLSEEHYVKSLEISMQIASWAPDNPSVQNDLAMDIMNFAIVLNNKGELQKAEPYWQQSEKILEKIINAKNDSIYYVDTYVNVLLNQGKIQQAIPYLIRMKNSEGWPHSEFNNYVKQYNIINLDQ